MAHSNGRADILEDTKMNITESSLMISNLLSYKKYTPFGMEFKKIPFTQLINYGQRIGINIPIIGNIIYRAFFEIELPVLNFTDSIITNTKYKQYKMNNLANIKNQISYWTDYYNNMKQFSNIMIEVYVDIMNNLKLQNITLSFIQSRVLEIINKYGENIYKYRLLIDSNILNGVDIAAYIISLTTLNINTLETTINNMYNNNINYLNYYYGNLNYYNNMYKNVNTGKIFAKWIDNIGHYYFNYFELVVNGITVDNYSSDFLHLYQTQHILVDYKDNYDSMIGNTDEIYISKGSPNHIYTPLIFSFNNVDEPSQSLPLIGMMNSNIRINSMVNEIKNLVYLQDWVSMYNDVLTIELRRDQHIVDAANCITPFNLPYDNIEIIYPAYIYIYHCNIINKNVLDAKYPGIDSTTILNNYGSKSEDGEMILTLDDYIYLMNNIKTDTFLTESTKIALAGYHYFIDYNYVLNLINKPKVNLLLEYGFVDNYEKKILAQNKLDYVIETHHEIILDLNKTSLYDSLNDIDGLIKDIYLFGRKKLNINGISPYGKSEYTDFNTDIIEGIQLNVSNEYNLFEYYDVGEQTFANIANYYLNSPLPLGVWYKTYSLNPYSVQPSGFFNMNHIKGQNIAVIVNDIMNKNYYESKNNPNNLGIEFKILYTKYNIMTVKDGNIELAFYN